MRLDNGPAPAKLNLFLHVIARRDDSYHLMQTVFHLVEDNALIGIRHVAGYFHSPVNWAGVHDGDLFL